MDARRVGGVIVAIATAGNGITSLPSIAAAQRTAQLSVSAGSATDERGVRSNAMSAASSVTMLPSTRVVITLGANATRFETAAWSAGGSATVASRTIEVAGAAMSLNGRVGLSRSSFGATFAVADATPALEWSVGELTIFGGARIVSGETRIRTSPQPVPLPGQSTLASARRTSMGPVFGGQWRVLGGNTAWLLTASYREERATVGRVRLTDRATGIALAAGRLSVAASAGERVESTDRMRFASGSASLALGPLLSLDLSAAGYPSDRVTGPPRAASCPRGCQCGSVARVTAGSLHQAAHRGQLTG